MKRAKNGPTFNQGVVRRHERRNGLQSTATTRRTSVYHLEPLEPRVLLSADLAGALEAAGPPEVVEPQAQGSSTLLLQEGAASAESHLLGRFGEGTNLVLHDADGTAVTFELAGDGTGEVRQQGSRWDLTLAGTGSQSMLIILTSGGDGRVALQDLHIEAPLGVLTASGADLFGTLSVAGGVNALTLGSVQGGTISAASLRGMTVMNDMQDATLLIGAHLGEDGRVGGIGAETDTFGPGSIGTLYVRGSVSGTTVRVGQDPVDGVFDNGTDIVHGGAQSSLAYLQINGTLSEDSCFVSGALPSLVRVAGSSLDAGDDPRFKILGETATLSSTTEPTQAVAPPASTPETTPVTAAPAAGTLLGRFAAGTSLVLRDADGTAATFQISGAGVGEVWQNGSAWDLRLADTGLQSMVTVLASGGDGRLSLHDIHVNAPLGVLTAATTDVRGVVAVNGTISALTLGSVHGGTISAASLNGMTVLGDMSGATMAIGAHLGADGRVGGTGTDADTFRAGSIGTLTVRGSVSGTTVRVGQDPVDGVFDNGNDLVHGGAQSAIAALRIHGTLSADSRFVAGAFPATAQIGGVTVTIAGDPRFSTTGGTTAAPPPPLVTQPVTEPSSPLIQPTPEPTPTPVTQPSAPAPAPAPATGTEAWAAIVQQWESQMVQWGRHHGNNLSNLASQPWAVRVDAVYYDAQRVYFQIADYTGDASWASYAQIAEQYYREQYVMPNDGAVPGYWNFTRGLRMDYERTGDTRSRDAVLLLAQNAAFARNGTPLEWTAGIESSREVAYSIISYLNAEALGGPVTERKAHLIDQALSHIDQWFVSKTASYLTPFMVGLTMQALIQAYEASPDPRIPTAIATALEGLWREAWIPSASAFYYVNSNPTQAAPDLNMLIAPAYGWMYQQTGNTVYRDRGDQIFAGGVKHAYLGSPKQFNQNYTWSFGYLAWRGHV